MYMLCNLCMHCAHWPYASMLKPDTCINSSVMFLIVSPPLLLSPFAASPLRLSFSSSTSLPGRLQADGPPLMSRGSAQGFFLLTGSFFMPLSPLCFLQGGSGPGLCKAPWNNLNWTDEHLDASLETMPNCAGCSAMHSSQNKSLCLFHLWKIKMNCEICEHIIIRVCVCVWPHSSRKEACVSERRLKTSIHTHTHTHTHTQFKTKTQGYQSLLPAHLLKRRGLEAYMLHRLVSIETRLRMCKHLILMHIRILALFISS